MSLPEPPVDLEGHCSILHDNTLYVYTPETLVSIALEEDAEWKDLGQGQSVTDAECTKGFVDGDPDHPALYVVGGKGQSADYRGLQRYSLLDHEWETIQVDTTDLKDRVQHAAIFIPSASSILVFAGANNGNTDPSPSTFFVTAQPPYNVRSFNSYVPPSIAPLLLPWNEDEAIAVGGGPKNTEIYKFSGTTLAWINTGATLEKALPDRSIAKCAIVSGDDGSKVLEVFNMGESPNTVTRYVLFDAGGTPARPGKTVGEVSDLENPSKRRGISLTDYPAYDGENAPETTRKGFSLAQGDDGTVVIAGGGVDKEHAVSVFDMSENSWVDTEQLFLGTAASSSVSSSTATSTSTSSPSLSASATPTIMLDPLSTETAAAQGDDGGGGGVSSKHHTLTIVGATLGAVLGLAAILIIVLLYLGWKKKKAKYPNGKPGPEDKDRLSFQDQGMEPLTKSMQPMGRGPPPSGTDSWALVAGQADSHPRKPPPATFNDFNFGTTEKGQSHPLRNMETSTHNNDSLLKETGGLTAGAAVGARGNSKRNAPRGDRLTDEGWAKYFQGDSRGEGGSDRSSQETKSDYGTDPWPHASAEVPPLTLNTLDQPRPLGRVASGSPSREQLPKFEVAHHQGMAAKISSADSASISSLESEDDNNKDAFSSGVPASIPDDSWTPVRSPFAQDRVASSNYSDSLYTSTNNHNSDHRLTQWPDHSTPFARDSGPPSNGHGKKLSSDVSWLNLGNNR